MAVAYWNLVLPGRFKFLDLWNSFLLVSVLLPLAVCAQWEGSADHEAVLSDRGVPDGWWVMGVPNSGHKAMLPCRAPLAMELQAGLSQGRCPIREPRTNAPDRLSDALQIWAVPRPPPSLRGTN